ncbi:MULTISPECIES: hypothetical protein [Streptomyces]|uniref:Uncharacterized protein n=1 Tax=Streptomyces apricus TaxID=1828112 RepID=A0A5B0BN67_9ACTN|nr:hypothetical protein [Streptomyces apricus]KAA0942215.1 hypothetical protein FGF04_03820 [Streptomyces apricus]
MSQLEGRDWTRMTPDDFDEDAPPRPDTPAGPPTVPAVPDECGTAPLFGDETQGPHLDQLELF